MASHRGGRGWSSHRTALSTHDCEEVRELTAQEVREGRAVKLKAVITHTQGAEGGFYLQDATAGLFVLPMGLAKDLKVGDQVEVEGKTLEGESATDISAHSIKRIGTQPLPPSELYDLAIGDSPGFDGRRVHAGDCPDRSVGGGFHLHRRV